MRRKNPVTLAKEHHEAMKRLLGCVYCSVPVVDVIGLMKALGIDREITNWCEGSNGQQTPAIGGR
jgi:hypothetical protein